MSDPITRRQALQGAGAGALGLGALSGVEGLLAAAAGARTSHAKLSDIEHVVILIQENRSFDHYFGTLSGVRGFCDRKARHGVFEQRGADGRIGRPFHLATQCFADITHDWGPQHKAWNGGRMDRFLSVHEVADKPKTGTSSGPETMGYYTRSDLPLYHALADAFTICDGYHCSVIGPTDPNRLMSMSATVDPAGHNGGPLLHTKLVGRTGGFSWTTMPEQLQRKGISWKQYTDHANGGDFDSVLTYFNQYAKGTQLYDRGIAPTYADFLSDLSAGRLPQVSWLVLGIGASEHPGFSSPIAGEAGAREVVEALASHSDTWRKTALFITWDENGGFFDHVPPPTAPLGTPGEYITVSKLPDDASGIRGPIGLGFRVPMLVVSPFSRGGLVCSNTFDHTSTLRFLETRFRVRVPNLSAWRRKTTGDLTRAFNFAARAHSSRPRLPDVGTPNCPGGYAPIGEQAGAVPRQERGRRRRPSGIVR